MKFHLKYATEFVPVDFSILLKESPEKQMIRAIGD